MNIKVLWKVSAILALWEGIDYVEKQNTIKSSLKLILKNLMIDWELILQSLYDMGPPQL